MITGEMYSQAAGRVSSPQPSIDTASTATAHAAGEPDGERPAATARCMAGRCNNTGPEGPGYSSVNSRCWRWSGRIRIVTSELRGPAYMRPAHGLHERSNGAHGRGGRGRADRGLF